ncbi:ABC transporter substrate-binding protein [Micromonospora sp. KC213]|uniref:ABC transporter substrate-binding protein n=1 Tax=Micromonospora sp. KC213 TaxID=2530378 RepID=UPI001050E736|nr:ABC transporter substrate-binding protein [Micromonospora sp. KC213]TDC43349.1 hypothetical protein E1166_04305 [Micromonospora sp. KC213]
MRETAGSPVAGVPTDFFTPRVPRSRRVLRLATATAAVAALVAASALVVNIVVTSCGSLRSGLTRVGGECVGVLTDVGAHTFEGLGDVQQKIREQNEIVRAKSAAENQPYVRVALLSPMTSAEKSFMSKAQVRHAVQGAYVAQVRANGSDGTNDPPLIELVLANVGSRQEQWRRVVRTLEQLADDENPLVAVIGMGTSIAATRDAAQYLAASDSGLPMIAGVATADDFRDIEGFVRASPSDTDYVLALNAYLQTRTDLRKGMVVFDESEPDLYVRSLLAAYRRILKDYLLPYERSFVGAGDPGQRARFLEPIATSVCTDPKPDMILYAGRVLDLDDFVNTLASRQCFTQKPLTILVGATGLTVSDETAARMAQTGITIVTAASVHPSWFTGDAVVPAPKGLAAFVEAFRAARFGDEATLTDGYALTHHDAMATAVTAIRMAKRSKLSAADVRGQLLNLNKDVVIPSAGGELSYTTGRRADPVGKWVPITVLPAGAAPIPKGTPFITG